MNTEILFKKIERLETICAECGREVDGQVRGIKEKIINNDEITRDDHVTVLKALTKTLQPL